MSPIVDRRIGFHDGRGDRRPKASNRMSPRKGRFPGHLLHRGPSPRRDQPCRLVRLGSVGLARRLRPGSTASPREHWSSTSLTAETVSSCGAGSAKAHSRPPTRRTKRSPNGFLRSSDVPSYPVSASRFGNFQSGAVSSKRPSALNCGIDGTCVVQTQSASHLLLAFRNIVWARLVIDVDSQIQRLQRKE